MNALYKKSITQFDLKITQQLFIKNHLSFLKINRTFSKIQFIHVFFQKKSFFLSFQMSEMPETITVNKTPQNMSHEMASMLENFNKKNPLTSQTTVSTTSPLTTNGLASRQNLLNASSNSTSSVSQSSQQVSVFKLVPKDSLTPDSSWHLPLAPFSVLTQPADSRFIIKNMQKFQKFLTRT